MSKGDYTERAVDTIHGRIDSVTFAHFIYKFPEGSDKEDTVRKIGDLKKTLMVAKYQTIRDHSVGCSVDVPEEHQVMYSVEFRERIPNSMERGLEEFIEIAGVPDFAYLTDLDMLNRVLGDNNKKVKRGFKATLAAHMHTRMPMVGTRKVVPV